MVAGAPKETPSGAPRRHVARLARTARRREGPQGGMAAELSRRRTALAGTTRVLLGSLAPTPRRQAGPAHAAARVSGGRGQSGQLPRAGRHAAHAAAGGANAPTARACSRASAPTARACCRARAPRWRPARAWPEARRSPSDGPAAVP